MTVANSAFRPTPGTPLVPVFFTLRVDGVSQELLETFNITLMLNSGTAPPELFYPDTSVSIMDRDGELFYPKYIHKACMYYNETCLIRSAWDWLHLALVNRWLH